MVCIHQQFAFFPPIVFLRLIYVDICSLIYSFSLLYNFSLNDYVTAYSFIPLLMDMVDNSRFFLLFWLSFYVLFLFIYLFVFGWFCLDQFYILFFWRGAFYLRRVYFADELHPMFLQVSLF